MFKHIATIGIAGILVACSAVREGTTHSEKSMPHSFGIFLVNFTPVQRWTPATLGSLADLVLDEEPVISDTDILSYDFASHTLLVRRSALTRLPSPPLWHQPFVLVADGQRIYVGAFSTSLSSFSAPVPSILVDFRDFTNELTINWGYPPGLGVGNDPRSDDRILAALGALRKLK